MYSSGAVRGAARAHRPRPGLARRRRAAPGHHARTGRGAAPAGQLGHHVRAGDATCCRPAETTDRLPLLDVERRARRRLAARRRLPASPSALARALAAGAARARRRSSPPAPSVTGVEVGRRPGHAPCVTDRRARSPPRSSSTRPAPPPGTSAGWPAWPSRSCRSSTSTSSPAPLPDVGPRVDIPTVRDPDHIVYFRGERRRPARRRLHPRPPTSAGRPTARRRWRRPRSLFEPDLATFAESWATARRRVPALRDARHRPGRARAGGVHPRRRVPARRDRGRRLLGRRRVLRARARRGRRRRQGDRRVDRRRHARVRRVHDGHPPLRRPRRQPGLGHDEGPGRATPATTTSSTRARSGPPPGRCAARPTWPRLADTGRRARREGRLGAGQLVRRQRRRRGDAGAAPARLGRADLVAGDRGRGRARPPTRPGCSTSPRSPSSTCAAPARSRLLQRLCANDVDRPVGTRRLHPAAQRRAPGSRPT